eukprot:scaffold25902_cov157-Isochrysis_galbana.AAC.2
MHLERASHERGSHPAAACSFAIAAHSSFGAAARRQTNKGHKRPRPSSNYSQALAPPELLVTPTAFKFALTKFLRSAH